MYICCAGMVRSGSTLQYNIVCEVLEQSDHGLRLGWEHFDKFHLIRQKHIADKYNIFKSHFLTKEMIAAMLDDEASAICYTYRDIRDVCVSIMQKEDRPFTAVYNSKTLDQAIEQFYVIKESPLRKYIQAYETMLNDLRGEITRVADFFGVNLSEDATTRVADGLSIDAQQDKISRYNEEGDYVVCDTHRFNPDTLLHLNHIRDGKVNKFASVLTPEQIRMLEERYRTWLLENRYLHV